MNGFTLSLDGLQPSIQPSIQFFHDICIFIASHAARSSDVLISLCKLMYNTVFQCVATMMKYGQGWTGLNLAGLGRAAFDWSGLGWAGLS